MLSRCKELIVFVLLVCVSISVPAECVQEESGTSGEKVVGTLLGAAIGGLVGSQIGGGSGKKIAIGAGVLAGGFLGHRIASKMTCKDQEYHYDTTQTALEKQPTGASTGWTNPDSGHSGSITPTKTYVADNGLPCREFTQNVEVDGQVEEVTATACRQEDGTWQIIDS